MQKTIFLIGAIFSWFSPAFAQTDYFPEGSLYARAISVCMTKEKVAWGPTSKTFDFSNRIVINAPGITDGLPTQFGDIKVEYIGNELKDRYKKTHQEIWVSELSSLFSEGTNLKVNIRDSWFSYKKNTLGFAMSDGCMVTFVYDCATKKFVVSNAELWGI